jgi:hypothetical protein
VPKPVSIRPTEITSLERGQQFSVRLAKSLPWKDLHRVFHHTAGREVTLTLRGGEKITGTLSETPGYFSLGTKAGPRLWLRVPGRKTRKGIDIREVKHLIGYKSPTLADALGAFILLSASNPSEEQVAESRAIAAQM